MVVYSIKEIEKLSGVKAHTLRIWEKRYGIIKPERTDTNIRFYTDHQLKKILNISFLNRKDIKISKIAQLTEDELKRKVSELSDVDVAFEDQLDALVLSLLELDSYNFNKILDQHIEQIGFEQTMDEFIYPLMDKLSIMWMAGSIKSVHESFVTAIVRAKIIAAIDKLEGIKQDGKSKIIIYLPENEDHELSLLFLEYLLKKYHYEVINLGVNNTIHDIREAIHISGVDYLFTIINESFEGKNLSQYIERILDVNDKTTFLVSGAQPIQQGIKSSNRCIVLKSMKETIDYLDLKSYQA